MHVANQSLEASSQPNLSSDAILKESLSYDVFVPPI